MEIRGGNMDKFWLKRVIFSPAQSARKHFKSIFNVTYIIYALIMIKNEYY